MMYVIFNCFLLPFPPRELLVLLVDQVFLVSRDRLVSRGTQDLMGYLELKVRLAWKATRDMTESEESS